jgi:hypothetical protein
VTLVGCVALFVAWQLGQVGIARECLYSNGAFGPVDPTVLETTCQATRDQFYELVNVGGQVLALAVLVPWITGLLIGVPLIAREVETGTASLAWTLSRSRWRWYLRRVIPLVAIVGLVLLLPAIATVVMEGARQPAVDAWASFDDGSLRGPVVVFRGVLAMSVGVLAGAVLGRQLPGVIVGGLLAIVVMAAVPAGVQAYATSLAEWRTAEQSTPGDMTLTTGLRDRSSGAIVDYDAAYAAAPTVAGGGVDDDWVSAHFDQVASVVPGWRYPQVTALECAALGGLTIVALGLGGAVVSRRRPS